MSGPSRASSRLGRLVAERLAALKGQLAALASESVERATRSVGSAVGEAVRLALRAATGGGGASLLAAPPGRWHEHYPRVEPEVTSTSGYPGPFDAERYAEDPWDELADPVRLTDVDPWGSHPGVAPTADSAAWNEAAIMPDTTSGVETGEPHAGAGVPELRRGWWRRIAVGVMEVLAPARLTRASVTAAVVASVVTLLPPFTAALVGAALVTLTG